MRALILCASILFAGSSFAATKYYWAPDVGVYLGQFDSPSSGCSAAATYYQSLPLDPSSGLISRTYTVQGVAFVSVTRYKCNLKQVNTYQGGSQTTGSTGPFINRSGDSCASGDTYNSSTGLCDAPAPDKCLGTAGQSVFNEVDMGVIGATNSSPPGSVCSNACQYAFSYEAPTNVYRFVEAKEGKNLEHAYGKYRYQGNGTSCTQNNSGSTGSVFDQPATKPPTSPEPTKEIQQACGAWTTTGDGTATRSCTENSTYKNPGKLNCTTSGGTLSCSTGTPSPSLNDTKKTETTATKSGTDGSSDTTTTTTTNTTTCVGIKPCTTGSTTSTKGQGTNADGTSKPTTETCTGPKCGSDGDDEEEGESGEGEEEEPVESFVSGESCDAVVSCDGDAIQCAILRQQKASTCADELARDYTKAKPLIDAQLAGDDYQLKEETIDGSSMFSTGSRFLPSSCPADKTVFIESVNRSITFTYSYICSFAESMSFIVVAMASLFFIIYVGRSFGGE